MGINMQLATWNVNSLAVRLPHVLDWLAAHPVDVLALQEIKLTDDKFPHAAFADLGYQCVCFGQKTYNGVALITRQPVQDVVRNIPGFDDPLARVITATTVWSTPAPAHPPEADVGLTATADAQRHAATPPPALRVVGAYFPNGQAPDSDKFAYKLRWLQALHDWLRDEFTRHPHLVLMGDFNIAPTDADTFDPDGLRGTIHHTDVERAHFDALRALGLRDAFRLFDQAPRQWSWWDYRDLAFRRNRGLRIDHILISDPLVARARACTIDKAPRQRERPSDHVPVLLSLN